MKRIMHGLTRGLHGGNKPGWYKSWWHGRDRATNPKCWAYAEYGGAGRIMCDGFQNDPARFYRIMGDRPPRLTLERMDNKLGYLCGECEQCVKNGWKLNCQWKDRTHQARNRKNTVRVTYDGFIVPLVDWSEITGIPYAVLHDRLYRYRLPALLALTKPYIPQVRKKITVDSVPAQ